LYLVIWDLPFVSCDLVIAKLILLDKMNKPEIPNLSGEIKDQLPSAVVQFIREAGEVAEKRQQRLYLVGGMVRDLLLGRINTDIDLVVEGDAIKLAEEIALAQQASILTHPRFRTAKIKWGGHSADFATARAETYARPGALPDVKPGTIKDDLARRDFTINAMAVELNPRHFGELLDPYKGQTDLKYKAVRVLHEKSFTDDATRIWRAIRYEQRLDFIIEPLTLLLIERDLPMLKTISGDRLRHELELVLKEETPEKSLVRADELGVLAKLHPSFKADTWLVEMLSMMRRLDDKENPPPSMYIGLLGYRLTVTQAEKLIGCLRLTKETARILKDVLDIKEKSAELARPGQSPSAIYDLLFNYDPAALTVVYLASGSGEMADNIDLYLNVLRHVKPALTANDLMQLGIPQGPKIKAALKLLREARLDGTVNSKKGEADWVKGWIKGK
jgi:tRNA nucleotidyltransferase (CCA-adding enzyme)